MSAPLKFELDRRQGVINIGYGAGSSPSFASLTVTGVITVGGSVHGANGSATNPSFAFLSDQDTGLYRIGANNIGVAANGTKVLDISTTGLTVVGVVNVADGTAAAPSISFSADPDTGFYRAAANQIRLALGGNGVYTFTSTGNISSTATGATLLLSDATGAIGLTAAGTNQNITLTPSGTGTVVSANVNFDVTSSLVTAEVYYTGAFAIGRGGSIALGGLVDGSNSSTFAAIAGQKESAVSGATGGYLGLFTRASGAAMGERARILSTGRFLLGTTTDSGALLQIGTNTTTSAGGMVFGTDCFVYRSSGNSLIFNGGGTGDTSFSISDNGVIGLGLLFDGVGSYVTGTGNLYLRSNGGTTALTLDSSQRTILSGALRLNNAYVAGAVVGTGYVTIQDSTGTTYRVPVLV